MFRVVCWLIGVSFVVWFFGTQLIWPIIKGTELFPLLNKSSRALENERTDVVTKLEENQYRTEVEGLKSKLEPPKTEV